MKEWVGSIYPAGTVAKNYLRAYGQQFNTIELNTTHYRIPTLEQIARWRAETPADFRFCPKMPQTISHARQLGLDGPGLDLFVSAVAALEEKLGAVFVQFPPTFNPSRWPTLQRFLERWPQALPLSLELRHPEWFASTDPAQEAIFSYLQKRHIGLVLTDVAGRRDVLHMRISSPQVLLRLVGNNLHPSDYQRADAWLARLEQWRQLGLREAYIFAHEPDNLHAPVLARHLAQGLAQYPQLQGRGPQWPETPPQMTLF